jgi:site-specific recombinase XerD
VAIVRDRHSRFSDIIDAFLVAKTLAPKSRKDYGRYLREYDQFTRHKNLEEALTLDLAAQWIEQMRPRGLHAAHNAACYLKSLASWVAKSRIITIPGGGSILAGLEAPTTPKSQRKAFTDVQLDMIFAAMDCRPNRDRLRAVAYIHLLAACGIRRNEARQVLMGDVMLDVPNGRGVVRVKASTSKGMKERVTRIGADAVRAIYLYVQEARPKYTGPIPHGASRDDNRWQPLFLAEGGKPFLENGFGTWASRIWDDIEKATGIKGSSHLLRHTWATNYNRGMQFTGNNVYDLKREGGWADLAIPLTYVHDRPEEELLAMPTPIDELRKRRKAI